MQTSKSSVHNIFYIITPHRILNLFVNHTSFSISSSLLPSLSSESGITN